MAKSEVLMKLSDDLRVLIKKYYGKIKLSMIPVTPNVNVPEGASVVKLLGAQQNMILGMRQELTITSAVIGVLLEMLPVEQLADLEMAVDEMVRRQMVDLDEAAKAEAAPKIVLPE